MVLPSFVELLLNQKTSLFGADAWRNLFVIRRSLNELLGDGAILQLLLSLAEDLPHKYLEVTARNIFVELESVDPVLVFLV